MSSGATSGISGAQPGGSAAQASVAQKGNQEQHRDKRSTADDTEQDHAYSEYYVNTHLRRRGYILPTPPSAVPSSAPVDAAALGQPEGWDEDEDEGLDDEQGAQWEEWSREQKNEWVEKQVREFIPLIKEHYALPSNDRVNSNQDTAVFEGYGGIAYAAFHTYIKVLSSLPANVQSFSASTPSSVRHMFTPAASQHAGKTDSPAGRARNLTDSPSGRVRNLAINVPADSSSQSPRTPGSGSGHVRNKSSAEHIAHVKRQHCISMLQDAFDYIQYCLALLDDKKEKKSEAAAGEETNLSEEDKKALKACEQRVSFLRGKAGIYALAALIYHHRARYLLLHPTTTPNVASPAFDPNECLKQRGECMSKLLEMRTTSEEDGVDVEAFNGRAGYLYALNFVYSHLMDEAERMEKAASAAGGKGGASAASPGASSPGDRSLVDNMDDTNAQPAPSEECELMKVDELHTHLNVLKSTIELVHNRLIADGTQKGSDVLSYTWHEKEYYGAAHGLAGILQHLLQSPASILQPTLPAIRASVDHLLSKRHDSGNLPSSANSTNDRLVQWCHGAPAASLLAAQLYTVTRDQKYLTAAIESSEVVWRRGLLKKGVGLCHGIAGNGYVLLTLYHVTGEEVWLKRAYHFAHFAMAEHRNVLFRQPDKPYSLFNGMAGLVCYAVDMEQCERTNSTFPAYQLLKWGVQK